jgi:hypothetical protein
MLKKTVLCTKAWLLMGLTGSTPGVLKLANEQLSFVVLGSGALTRSQLKSLEKATQIAGLACKLQSGEQAQIFNVALPLVQQIVFPWYYFSGGAIIQVENSRYRFSFLQPQNTKLPIELSDDITEGVKEILNISSDIIEGRQIGKAWRIALETQT